jgi:hypothetical protein
VGVVIEWPVCSGGTTWLLPAVFAISCLIAFWLGFWGGRHDI